MYLRRSCRGRNCSHSVVNILDCDTVVSGILSDASLAMQVYIFQINIL
jgi:hypothetical protein